MTTTYEWVRPRVSNKTKNGTVVKAFDPVARLKRTIRGHFTKLGFTKAQDGTLALPGTDKEIVRQLHHGQRIERLSSGAASTSAALRRVLRCSQTVPRWILTEFLYGSCAFLATL
jgi:hypothetical protein